MLSVREKAEVLARLAALEHAGVPPSQAFPAAGRDLPGRRGASLVAAGGLAAKGLSVAEVGRRAGLLDRADAAWVRTAQVAGQVGAVYDRLGEQYRRSHLRLARLKSKLILPVALLTLALLVRPAPALILGEITAGHYLALSIGPLLLLLGSVYALAQLWPYARETRLASLMAGVIQHLPGIGGWLLQRYRVEYLEGLALSFAAGVPLLTGVALAEGRVLSPVARAQLGRIRHQLQRGSPLHQALAACPWMPDPLVRLVLAGESAGRLSDTLDRIVTAEREALEALCDTLGTLGSRLAYLLVAGWVAGGVLAG